MPVRRNGSASKHGRHVLIIVLTLVLLIACILVVVKFTRTFASDRVSPTLNGSTSPGEPLVSIYAATDNGFITKITPDGLLSIVAGNGNISDKPLPGPAVVSPMHPADIAINRLGDIFVSDLNGYIERITPDGSLSIFAGNGHQSVIPLPGPATESSMFPMGVAIDMDGNVIIADAHGYIEKVTPSGTLSIVAGNGKGMWMDAPVPGPAINSPMSPVRVAVDAVNNIYIADNNGYVEKVTPEGVLSIVAGNGVTDHTPIPGIATNCPLNPSGIAVDGSGNILVADSGGYILRITLDGALSIVAGDGHGSYSVPPSGQATQASLRPAGVSVDANGIIYISDGNGYIESVTPLGVMTIIAGIGRTSQSIPIPGLARESPLFPMGTAIQDYP